MFSTTYDEEERVWAGLPIPPLYNPQISLAQVLLRSLKSNGPKIAQISDNNGIQMSFDEIRSKTVRAAQNLQSRGYVPKQVFGILARNSHHLAPIVFASISIGCPVNTLDCSFGKTELMHMLKTTKPKVMFADVDVHDLLKECLIELGNNAKVFTFGGSTGDSEPVENLFAETHKEDQFIPASVDGPNEMALIICSSGTTGLSKGVCLSHATLLDTLTQLNIFGANDRMLCFSSLYWLSGVAVLLMGTISGTTRVITTETFSPELQLEIIGKSKITYTINAPHQLLLMMKSDRISQTDMSSLKYLFVGGSKVPFHLHTEIKKYIPTANVHVGYGMSETAGFVSFDFPIPVGRDTVGQLANGLKVKIIDEDGNRCGKHVDGEICVKTVYRFLGYYGSAEASAELCDNEGFILTGDIGHFDDDGYLYIVGRKKEIIKYRNFQISPSEIDNFLTKSPDINSACVVGVPDVVSTDLPAAVIVRANGSNISEKEVFDMVAGHFADYCKLRGGVYFVDSLPTTPSGKVLRRSVKDIAVNKFNEREL